MTTQSRRQCIVERLISYGALTIRDIEAGEEPFLYSSKNRGPGYLMIKGLVSQRMLLESMVELLAYKVQSEFPNIEYVSGNATGGMIPAFLLATRLEQLLGRTVPYFYVRNTRKIGGHGELITGDKNNDFFRRGRRGIVMEELVNFAETTCNSAIVQRDAGYDVRHGASLVNYDHAKSRELLASTGVTMLHLFTVGEILDLAEGKYEKRLVDDYRSYLANPVKWQLDRGYPLPETKETKEST